MKIQMHLDLIIPEVPNFIYAEQKPGLRQDGLKEAPKVSIAELTDEQLIEIGKSWTENLIKKAKSMRGRPEPLRS